MYTMHSNVHAAPNLAASTQNAKDCKIGMQSSTLLFTDSGAKPAGRIDIGDHVMTFENGLRRVVALRRYTLSVSLEDLPVFVPAGAIGNAIAFSVPQDQILVVESDQAEDCFGDPFILVRAIDLVGHNGITRMAPSRGLDVVALEFDTDEILYGANGELLLCPASQNQTQPTPAARPAAPQDTLASAEEITQMFTAPKGPFTVEIPTCAPCDMPEKLAA